MTLTASSKALYISLSLALAAGTFAVGTAIARDVQAPAPTPIITQQQGLLDPIVNTLTSPTSKPLIGVTVAVDPALGSAQKAEAQATKAAERAAAAEAARLAAVAAANRAEAAADRAEEAASPEPEPTEEPPPAPNPTPTNNPQPGSAYCLVNPAWPSCQPPPAPQP